MPSFETVEIIRLNDVIADLKYQLQIRDIDLAALRAQPAGTFAEDERNACKELARSVFKEAVTRLEIIDREKEPILWAEYLGRKEAAKLIEGQICFRSLRPSTDTTQAPK